MNLFSGQKKSSGPLVVGLTGQTGAGKSTVTEAFAEKGFVVIDCDALTRQLQTRPAVLSMLSGSDTTQIAKGSFPAPLLSGRPKAVCARLPRTSGDRPALYDRSPQTFPFPFFHPDESGVTGR